MYVSFNKMTQPIRFKKTTHQNKIKLQDVKAGYEKAKSNIKSGLKKGAEKVRQGVAKVQAFHQSPEGKLFEKLAKEAAIKYLRQSGIGKKVNDSINNEAAKITKDLGPLDDARKIIHASYDNYFQQKEPLPKPKYNPYRKPTVYLTRSNYQRPTFRYGPRHMTKRR